MAEKLPYVKDLASWLGIAWIVAFLAGLWGVMIGVGKFEISEFLFLVCGAIVLIKVGHETMRHRTKKRLIALIACLLIVSLTEYGVILWTGGLSVEAQEQKRRLSQLDQIPTLTTQLDDLKNAEKIAEAKSQQQVDDIAKENRDLKASIDKKDAALVQIAKEQYSLNFFPQVLASTEGKIDEVQIINNGKTNVDLYEIDVEKVPQDTKTVPALIVQGARVGFQLSEQQKVLNSQPRTWWNGPENSN